MKQKNHSGLKKRIRIKSSGVATVSKAGRRHLLSNKSKRQKKLNHGVMAVSPTRLTSVKRLLPGLIK